MANKKKRKKQVALHIQSRIVKAQHQCYEVVEHLIELSGTPEDLADAIGVVESYQPSYDAAHIVKAMLQAGLTAVAKARLGTLDSSR